jgi:hypothetical protein
MILTVFEWHYVIVPNVTIPNRRNNPEAKKLRGKGTKLGEGERE